MLLCERGARQGEYRDNRDDYQAHYSTFIPRSSINRRSTAAVCGCASTASSKTAPSAIRQGVNPLLFFTSSFAPAATSISTAVFDPHIATPCSAVLPSLSTVIGSAPRWRRNAMAAAHSSGVPGLSPGFSMTSPDAARRGVSPVALARNTSAPCSASSRIYGRSSVCAATQNAVAPSSVSRLRPTLVTSGFLVAARLGSAPRAI